MTAARDTWSTGERGNGQTAITLTTREWSANVIQAPADDAVIYLWALGEAGFTVTPPTGFSLVGSLTGTAAGDFYLYRKVAASESSSYSFSCSSSGSKSFAMFSVLGGVSETVGTILDKSSSPWRAPAVSVPSGGGFVIALLAGVLTASQNFTGPGSPWDGGRQLAAGDTRTVAMVYDDSASAGSGTDADFGVSGGTVTGTVGVQVVFGNAPPAPAPPLALRRRPDDNTTGSPLLPRFHGTPQRSSALGAGSGW